MNQTQKIISCILNSIYMLTILICTSVNYLLDKKLSWSLIVVTSIIFVFIIGKVILLSKTTKSRIKNILITISLCIVPFIAAITYITNTTLFKIDWAIMSVVSLSCIFILYLLYFHFNFKGIYIISIGILFSAILTLIGNILFRSSINNLDLIGIIVSLISAAFISYLIFSIAKIKGVPYRK